MCVQCDPTSLKYPFEGECIDVDIEGCIESEGLYNKCKTCADGYYLN